MLKNENEGKIKIRFSLNNDEDLKTNKSYKLIKEEIYNHIINFFNSQTNSDSPEIENDIQTEWNLVRGEMIRVCLVEYMFPYFENNLREELKRRSG